MRSEQVNNTFSELTLLMQYRSWVRIRALRFTTSGKMGEIGIVVEIGAYIISKTLLHF